LGFLALGIAAAITHWDAFKANLEALGNWLKSSFLANWNALTDNIRLLLDELVVAIDGMWNKLREWAAWVATAPVNAWTYATQYIRGLWDQLTKFLADGWASLTKVVDDFVQHVEAAINAVKRLLGLGPAPGGGANNGAPAPAGNDNSPAAEA